MTADSNEVCADPCERDLPQRLYSVCMEQNLLRMGCLRHPADRHNRSGFVIDCHHGNQNSPLIQFRFIPLHINPAFSIHRNTNHLEAFMLQTRTRLQHCRMFHRAGDNFVPPMSAAFRSARNHCAVPLCTAGIETDLLRSRPQNLSHLLPRQGDAVLRRKPQPVQRGRISEILTGDLAHQRCNLIRLPRCRTVIQINHIHLLTKEEPAPAVQALRVFFCVVTLHTRLHGSHARR